MAHLYSGTQSTHHIKDNYRLTDDKKYHTDETQNEVSPVCLADGLKDISDVLTTKYNMESVQGLYCRIFQAMMDNDIMRKSDPALLSMSFAAPVSLLIQMCDREPEREREVTKRIEEYFRWFAEENKV